MTVHQVHSPASGRVSGWVGPKTPKASSSTCSRKSPEASASATYPMATRRVLVMEWTGSDWQASQDSNLEHAVLETAALPLELLAWSPSLLRLLVIGVLAAAGAELGQDQLVGHG